MILELPFFKLLKLIEITDNLKRELYINTSTIILFQHPFQQNH